MMGTISFHHPLVDRGTIAAANALLPDIGAPRIIANIPAKPMTAPSVKLKSRGFYFAHTRPAPLRHTHAATNMSANTPAKPMWISVFTLKLRGFFIASTLGQHHLAPEVVR